MAYLQAVQKQGNYFIVFKTYTQAHQVVWKQYLNQIPQQLIKSVNNDELSITFHYLKGTFTLADGTKLELNHDTNQPPSTIRLLGSDQAESHRGIKAHGIIFDEYADQNPDNWDAVYQPMFSTTDGWAVFLSTPKGYNHWEQLVREAQDHPELWYYSEATWRDNPMITKEFIDGVREEAIRRDKLTTFLQEYELEFRSVEGAVYPSFDRKIHVVKPSAIPTEGTYYCGIDFGFENPTAVCFILVDYQGIHWQWDEIYVSHTTINDLAEIIWQKLGDRQLSLMVGDSAQAEHIANLQSKGFPIVPVSKIRDSIPLGINLITQMLKPKIQLAGPPKPSTYIGSNCIHTMYEFEQYKYPEAKNELNPKEVPLKANDHMMDARRYLELYLRYDKGHKEEPVKKMQFRCLWYAKSKMKHYLLDIQQEVDSTDWGEVQVTVKRGRSKTNAVDTRTTTTMKYDDNTQALTGLLKIIDGLLTSNEDHDLTFTIAIKKGMIQLIGYQNKKTKVYS